MRKVKIITDSCADLSAEQLEKYDIDYARMSTIEDGKESPALLTWTPAEAHRLYETIRGGKHPTQSADESAEEKPEDVADRFHRNTSLVAVSEGDWFYLKRKL